MRLKDNPSTKEFRLIERLGGGGFGEVWLAHPPEGKEKIAVKFLRIDRDSRGYLDFFKREFQILSELRHVNLARVYDFGYSAEMDQYYFSSEFCSGKELVEAMRGKPASYFEEILVQMLLALDCIHSQGIIHFDVKPPNILVSDIDGKPEVKLVDFGVAAKLSSLPRDLGGTLIYMAPELIDKKPSLDHRVDLYALGVVSLYALTGRLPFLTDCAADVIEWHRQGAIPESIWSGRNIPSYLREIVEKLLAKNPSDRFSNSRVALNFLNLATDGKYRRQEEGLQAQIPKEGPLIERREDALEVVQRRLQNALAPHEGNAESCLLTLCGETGIGKTRILEETRYFLQLRQIPFLTIHCDGSAAAWPQLARWLNLPEIPETQIDEAWRIQNKVDAILEKAKSYPFCLLLDDFHRADRELKKVVAGLAERTQRERAEGNFIPIFMLAATEEETPEGLKLKRLSLQGVYQYIQLVLGEDARLEKTAQLLYQYSGGLPLLMVEGLRHLAPKMYRGEAPENLFASTQIHQLYHYKIESLSPEERTLLHTIALLFRRTHEDEISQILKFTPRQIRQAAGDLSKKGLLNARMRALGQALEIGERPSFEISSQALALDLLNSMDPKDRELMHFKISQGLLKIPESSWEEIASHLSRGGQKDAACHFFRRAGFSFKEQGRISSATDCFFKALQICEAGTPGWQELILEVARMLILSGSYREAEESLKALENHPSFEREELQGWLAYKQKRFPEARARYERALAYLPEEISFRKILIENALANVDIQEQNLNEAVARFRRTLEWERHLAPTEKEKVDNNNFGLALCLKGNTEGAIHFYQERLKHLKPSKTKEEIELLNGLGFAYLQGSHFEEAISHLKKALEHAERTGAMNLLFAIMGNLTVALLKEGRYAESLPLLQKLAAYQEKLGSLRDAASHLLRQGSVYLLLGMGEAARGSFEKGEQWTKQSSDANLRIWFSLMKGFWERELGSPDHAKEIFLKVQSESIKSEYPELSLWSLYALADAAFDEGQVPLCQYYLAEVKLPPKDEEFGMRLSLLHAKLKAATELKANLRLLFEPIEENCIKKNFREILWEVYLAWGRFEQERGHKNRARHLFEKGIQICDTIASRLPEEYRNRYLKVRSRKRLYDAYQGDISPKDLSLNGILTWLIFGRR